MSNPDSNTEAHRVVTEAANPHEKPLPADLEEAWAEWSAGVGKVDERGMVLLRAAFEAGYEVGAASGAAESGRAGGIKGGKARAESLTPERRSEIAKIAAAKRWGTDS